MPISEIPDEDIDTTEVPELGANFFDKAVLTRPGQSLIPEPILEFEIPNCYVCGGSATGFSKVTEVSEFTDVFTDETLESLDNADEVISAIEFLDRNKAKYLIKIQVFETDGPDV